MTIEWVLTKISEVADIHTKKVDAVDVELEEYVSTDNMLSDFGGVSPATNKPIKGKVTSFKAGDILFSNIRTYFKKLWLADVKGACSNDVIVFRPKKNIPSSYLYHVLMDARFIEYTVKTSKGTKMPRGDKSAIFQYEFQLAPEMLRSKIGESLIIYQNRIAQNQQTNQTLEEMAQTLFKSWFVAFDPVIDNALAAGKPIPAELQHRVEVRKKAKVLREGNPNIKSLPEQIQSLFPSEFEHCGDDSLGIQGWIPKSWEVASLSDVTIELRRGISPKYLEEGGVKVINQKCIRNHQIDFGLCRRNNPETRKVDGRYLKLGDVLVNSTGVGTLGRVAQVKYLLEPTVVDSHVTVVRPNPTKFPPYSFGSLMIHMERSIEALGEGSTGQTELSRKILSEQRFVMSTMETLIKFEALSLEISKKQCVIEQQIQSLAETRDTLLPKLISGEISLTGSQIIGAINA